MQEALVQTAINFVFMKVSQTMVVSQTIVLPSPLNVTAFNHNLLRVDSSCSSK